MSTMTSYEYAKDILKNCGVESALVELMGILRRMVDEYAHGSLSDQELEGYVSQLCQTITVLASRCGKSVALDACVNELADRIKRDSYAGAGLSLLEAFRERLRRRRTQTTVAGTPGILG